MCKKNKFKNLEIVKYEKGELNAKGGVFLPSKGIVFIEIGGVLEDEETFKAWLRDFID